MKNLIYIVLAAFIVFTSCTKEIIVKDIKNKTIVINAPADNFSTTSNALTFWWEPLDGTEKYNLQIVKPNFTTVSQLVVDTEITVTKFKRTLEPGIYQWRLKAINAGGSSAYQTFSFKIDTTSNLTNQLVNTIAPSNGFSTRFTKVNFSWNSLNSALQYQILLLNATNGIVKDTTTSLTSYTYTFPAQGGYSWKVRALNNSSISQYNTPQTFTIDLQVTVSSPSAPNPIPPAHGAVVTASSVLSWIRNGTPDTKYDSVIVAVDSTFSNIISATRTYQLSSAISALNNSSAIAPSSNYYFWRVVSVDSVRNISSPSFYKKFKMQ
jgi:hypothetical protein